MQVSPHPTPPQDNCVILLKQRCESWYLPSLTRTMKLQLPTLFELSEYWYVTVVSPRGKNDPDKCEAEILLAMPELSVAVGSLKSTVLPPSRVLMVMSMSAGHVTAGGVLSTAERKLWNKYMLENSFACCSFGHRPLTKPVSSNLKQQFQVHYQYITSTVLRTLNQTSLFPPGVLSHIHQGQESIFYFHIHNLWQTTKIWFWLLVHRRWVRMQTTCQDF